jgi:hypothetical protein
VNYDEILDKWSPAELRLHEALYFLRMFEHACGSEASMDRWLEWIANADAFVMALISVENLVSKEHKKDLNSLDAFRFLKAMRNATVHEMPWFAPRQARGATAPTRRAIYLMAGAKIGRWVKTMNSIDAVRTTLNRRKQKYKQERDNVEAARRYLRTLKRKTGNDNFFVIDVFKETFAALLDNLSLTRRFAEDNLADPVASIPTELIEVS